MPLWRVLMKRHVLFLAAALLAPTLPGMPARGQVFAPTALVGEALPAAAQDPAAPAQGGGTGPGRPQSAPPPTLTCTSPASPTDNKVPTALAKDGFTALFNGRDLT